MLPGPGYFVASFALGESACLATPQSGLPPQVLEMVQNAPKYPEGWAVRLEVRSKKDLASVEQPASIKMAN